MLLFLILLFFGSRLTPYLCLLKWCFCFNLFFTLLPRGSEDKLQELLKESGIPYHITEKKQKGRSIHVEFTGKLYQEQENAAERMLQYTYGILGAATGFGNK